MARKVVKVVRQVKKSEITLSSHFQALKSPFLAPRTTSWGHLIRESNYMSKYYLVIDLSKGYTYIFTITEFFYYESMSKTFPYPGLTYTLYESILTTTKQKPSKTVNCQQFMYTSNQHIYFQIYSATGKRIYKYVSRNQLIINNQFLCLVTVYALKLKVC